MKCEVWSVECGVCILKSVGFRSIKDARLD